MKRLRTLRGLIVCVCVGWASVGNADVVVDWNAITTQTIAAGARPGPSPLFDYAMVHAAMHDAVQAFDGRFEPYNVAIPNASGSPVAAAAAAAHGVLVGLFPAQQGVLDMIYTNYLTGQGLSGDPGVAAGEQAALGILNMRVGDGRFPSNPEVFSGGTSPGEWRPTSFSGSPPVPVTMVTPWLGQVRPFTLKAPAQFRANRPPHLQSGAYAKAYDEVKALGASVNSSRTQAQTDLAIFYNDNSIAYWNRALQSIADTYLTDIGDSARLFALVNLAAADAAITAWDSKRYWNFWRPLTAIREGDDDGNARTEGDPAWLPFIPTPSYPDYTSGANNLSGSATRMLAHFFGTDKVTFSISSANPDAVTPRWYTRFSDAADDIVNARIYQGIHFRFADVVARRQGRHVADWAFSHFLRPLSH